MDLFNYIINYLSENGREYLKGIFFYDENAPMIFTRFYFWAFFIVLLAGYSFIYKKKPLRNIYLLAFSLFFYYKSGGYFFSILIFSTVVDYTFGLLIAKSSKNYARKLFLTGSVFVNLLLLFYFKYTYFFTDITNQVIVWAYDTFGISGTPHHYEVVNLLAKWSNDLTGSHFDATTIILPVGISFYIFQTISYTVDVYRRKLEPVRNIFDFGFYVTYFPQLVAGPIVRAADFIPQLYKQYKVTLQEYGHAVFLILNGLLKKMIISDYISTNFVDRVFTDPLSYTGFENLMATYGYSIQIYCDFSGYTDIAIGVSLLLGFRLNLNFNSPYKAENITDFWRRWHISLSTWLRDYLYIPLGGNRKGKVRTYANLMVTMLLGGLWHGAAFKFIIWGGIHGVSLALHKLWLTIFPSSKEKKSLFMHFLSVLFTFHVVTFAWLFFRAKDMNTVNDMLSQIFSSFSPELIPEIISSYKMIFIVLLIGFIIHWLPSKFKEMYRGWFISSPITVKVLIVVLSVFLIYQFKSSDIQPFIYFQF